MLNICRVIETSTPFEGLFYRLNQILEIIMRIKVTGHYLLLFFFLLSCNPNVATEVEEASATSTLQELLEEAIYDSFESVPGVSMTVLAPELDLHWTGAAGFDSKARDHQLSADQPFRIASVTKSFVATAILRLHELGRLSIDDPLTKHSSPVALDWLKKGGYASDQITLRQCLNHTCGLYDYAMGGNTFFETIASNPKKRWTRMEQVALAMETGEAVGAPGEKYSYNDTGYVLLGEIIESKMDTSLAFGLRDLLHFETLKLDTTWLETLEPAPPHKERFVGRYVRGHDGTNWDASVDLFGGGGLVSTTEDLATFMYGLFNEDIYDQAETLDLMLEKASYAATYDWEEDKRYSDYRQGLEAVNIYGEKAFLHGGLWGTVLFYIPAYDCSIAINYTHGRRDRLLKKTVLLIKNLSDQKRAH